MLLNLCLISIRKLLNLPRLRAKNKCVIITSVDPFINNNIVVLTNFVADVLINFLTVNHNVILILTLILDLHFRKGGTTTANKDNPIKARVKIEETDKAIW